MKLNPVIEENYNFLLKKVDIEKYKNKTFLVTGSNGFIGSLFVTFLLFANQKLNANIQVISVNRHNNLDVWYALFEENDNLTHIKSNIYDLKIDNHIDYILHTASPTQSSYLREYFKETIDSIINNTEQMIKLALKNNAFLINFSSMEVYGKFDDSFAENRKLIKENELGYLDLNNSRNSYPLAKRISEFLCNNVKELKYANVRLAQVFGPGIKYTENKMYMQFIKQCINENKISIHGTGKSSRNMIYSTDMMFAIFKILDSHLYGTINVANENMFNSIYEFAKYVAKFIGNENTKIEVLNLSNLNYLEDVYLNLDTSLLKSTGWQPYFNYEQSLKNIVKSFN